MGQELFQFLNESSKSRWRPRIAVFRGRGDVREDMDLEFFMCSLNGLQKSQRKSKWGGRTPGVLFFFLSFLCVCLLLQIVSGKDKPLYGLGVPRNKKFQTVAPAAAALFTFLQKHKEFSASFFYLLM